MRYRELVSRACLRAKSLDEAYRGVSTHREHNSAAIRGVLLKFLDDYIIDVAIHSLARHPEYWRRSPCSLKLKKQRRFHEPWLVLCRYPDHKDRLKHGLYTNYC